MLKCHQIYPNCIWLVLLEWHGLNFDSALLTKVSWNYVTYIVRVCISSKTAINPYPYATTKSNHQVHFSSKATVCLYEIFCHHSVTCSDPLLEELFSHLPNRFPSQIFVYIGYEASNHEHVHSICSSVFAFYSDDSTYFSQIIFTPPFLIFIQLQGFYHEGRAQDSRKK